MSHFQMSINRHFHQCLINKGIIVAVNHDLFVLFNFFSMSSTHMRKVLDMIVLIAIQNDISKLSP